MTRYAVLYTLVMGRDRRHIVDAWITDTPEGTKVTDVNRALKASKYLDEFSERGVFLANRRIVEERRLPGDSEATDARTIPWTDLEGSGTMVQLNVRLPASERALYANAAASAGVPLAEWVRSTLRAAVDET